LALDRVSGELHSLANFKKKRNWQEPNAYSRGKFWALESVWRIYNLFVPYGNKTLIPQCLACIPVTINTFGHIHKVVKSDYKFHCVCLLVSPYGTTWLPVDRFHEILFSGFLLKSIQKIQF